MSNIQAMAAMFLVTKDADPAIINKLIEASKQAATDAKAAKTAGESRTGSNTTLLGAMREAGASVLAHAGWGRNEFDAILAIAVAQGAVESSLKAYTSTIGSFIAGARREVNPLDASLLGNAEVPYLELRNALRDEWKQEQAALKKSIGEAVGVLNTEGNLPELRAILKHVEAIAEPIKAKREADKKLKGVAVGKLPHKAADQPGEQAEADRMEEEPEAEQAVAQAPEAERQRQQARH